MLEHCIEMCYCFVGTLGCVDIGNILVFSMAVLPETVLLGSKNQKINCLTDTNGKTITTHLQIVYTFQSHALRKFILNLVSYKISF